MSLSLKGWTKLNIDKTSKNMSRVGCDGLVRGSDVDGYVVFQNLLKLVVLTSQNFEVF